MNILVTGATAGIGTETARQLAAMGHTIGVHGRSAQSCQNAIEDIAGTVPSASLRAEVCDLSSLANVRAWAARLRDQEPLDIIVHNAGVWTNERQQTVEGLELMWVVNHLAPFLLTTLLLDQLLERPAGRVIGVSSIGHRSGVITFEDPNLAEGFTPVRGYCQSKLANVLFTQELARRTAGTPLVALCGHPGIVNTKMLRQTGFANQPTDTPAHGARTSVFLATDKAVAERNGRYFGDCREERPLTSDPELGKRLWELSEAQCAQA